MIYYHVCKNSLQRPGRREDCGFCNPAKHGARRALKESQLIAQQAARIVELKKRVQDLEVFCTKFLDNFEDCSLCELGLDAAGQICSRCEGTGKQIDSRGILFVELPDEARALLAIGAQTAQVEV